MNLLLPDRKVFIENQLQQAYRVLAYPVHLTIIFKTIFKADSVLKLHFSKMNLFIRLSACRYCNIDIRWGPGDGVRRFHRDISMCRSSEVWSPNPNPKSVLNL